LGVVLDDESGGQVKLSLAPTIVKQTFKRILLN
jgi:hypothetical protein